MRAAKRSSQQSSQRDDPRPPADSKFDWSALLEEAIRMPGVLSEAYNAFHAFSLGNQLIALFECIRRGLPIGPISTYAGWQKLGRQVRKGEKAISLWMPLSIGSRRQTQATNDTPEHADADDRDAPHRIFVFRPHWFVIGQTDGTPVQPVVLPDWSAAVAMESLGITEVPFHHLDGNCQGFARGTTVAVSPVAYNPDRTRVHEMAHVVLGHTAESTSLVDGDERTPRDLREVEAESTAYLVISVLGLPGQEHSRGYLQHWLHAVPRDAGAKPIPDPSVHKIFRAADQILKAGRPAATPPSGVAEARPTEPS
jgi:antirestriction protein ArdC